MKSTIKDMNKNHPIKAIRRAAVSLCGFESADPAATIAGIEVALNGSAQTIPMANWDCARGLSAMNDAGAALVAAAGNPGPDVTIDIILTQLAKADVSDGILFAHNLHRFMSSDYVVQALWNLRDAWKAKRNVLVMMAPAFNLPAELNQDVLIVSEAAPTEEEILDAAKGIADASGGVEEYDNQKIVDATLGYLSRFAVEQSLALSVEKTGTKKAFNLARLWELKVQNLKATAGLEVMLPTESFDDLVGCEGYKDLIGKFLAGREQPRAVLHLDELEKMTAGSTGGDLSGVSQGLMEQFLYWTESRHVKGVLLVGVPGAGKTRAVTCTAGHAKVPHLRASMSTVKGGIVGESEANMKKLLKCVDAVAQGRVLLIATCLTECSLVAMNSAAIVPIKDIVKQNRLCSFNMKNGKQIDGECGGVASKKASVIRIATSGLDIVCTPDHTMFRWSPDGIEEVDASQIKKGDWLPTPKKWEHGKDRTLSPDLCWLLGYTAGDGNVHNSRMQWSEQDGSVALEIVRVCQKLFGESPAIHQRKKQDGKLIYSLTGGKAFEGISKFQEVVVLGSHLRGVPQQICESDAKRVAAFISGLFDADGSVYLNSSGIPMVSLGITSKQLRDVIYLLLLRFGITPTCSSYEPKPPRKTHWRLFMCGESAYQFAKLIGFRMPRKQALAESIPARKKSGKRGYSVDCVPVSNAAMKAAGFSRKLHSNDKHFYNGSADAWRLQKAVDSMKKDGFDTSAMDSWLAFKWVRVKSVSKVSEKMNVVDIKSVPMANFVANGVIVHNCNSVEALSPELMARFKLATFVFDYPTDAEATAIWKYYCKKYEFQWTGLNTIPKNVKNWVGREIESCCERAWLFDCSLAEAAKSVVPICNSNAKKMDLLRQSVSGRFLSASKMETYNFNPNAAEQKMPQPVRKMT